MVISKCYFDDLFKGALKFIEDRFDKDFKDDFPTSLKGLEEHELRGLLLRQTTQINECFWDRNWDEEKFNKDEYETLIYELIIFLLYMLKDSKGGK